MNLRIDDPIIYTGDQYVSPKPITGKIIDILPNGAYRLRIWLKRSSETREITASTEEFERMPEYIYRWRGEKFGSSKIYTTKRAASGQATANKNRYGNGDTWVQRAEVEWEDV